MLGKTITLIACTLLTSSAIAEDKPAEDLKDYRCVSNGLRQPMKWGKASFPRSFSRIRRKAMVDLKGKLKLVFPTYYMARKKNNRTISEYPFPNDVEIEAGIEPSYKMSNKDLDSSPRIVGNKVIYRKGDKATYKIITVDLGDTVINKGQWFGIWVALENLDGEKGVPMARVVGSSKTQNFETAYTYSTRSFIKNNFIRNAKKIHKTKLRVSWHFAYCPVAILAKTDYKGDIWGIIGSSIPEGYYDKFGDHYGDKNANLGYADKLFSTKFTAPSVNLAKGSDRYSYCATQLKGRLDILKLCGVNKVHIGLGGNDIAGRLKLKNMQKNSIEIVRQIKALDPKIMVYGSTILPHSRSKDGFTTLKQSSVYENSGKSSIRGRWNDLIRKNPKAGGFDGVHELCSFVEYDWKNSASLWLPDKTTPKKYTPDGTHPSCAGSEAIAKNAYLISSKSK